MSSTADIDAIKGQTVCRPPDWLDVARFFVFNYGLHAFTINLKHGSSAVDIFLQCFLSLVIPVVGIIEACNSILNCARREPDQLRTALKAGALGMVVPGDPMSTDEIDSDTIFHGQYPTTIWTPAKDTESEPSTNRWALRTVPKSFTVVPPIGAGAVPLTLSCNYSFLAATAGIAQVLSASWEIYHASERQIPNLGYAAYSLTVIPYLVMSIVNLVARMCQPQYPTMFLVRYRGLKAPGEASFNSDEVQLLPLNGDGTQDNAETELSAEPEIGGTVGDAYGDLSDTNADSNLFTIYGYSLFMLIAIVPYIVIAALTGFQSANSTVAQRAWIILWLVSGQVYIFILIVSMEVKKVSSGGFQYGNFHLVAGVIGVCLVVTCVIGGFVMVAQMILHDKMCFRV